MKSISAAPLLLLVLMGCELVVARRGAFLEHIEEDFLAHMKAHLDHSLKYLLTGIALDSQFVEKPGLAKVMRAESDRRWELGLSSLKKFIQRGGKTFEHNTFTNAFTFEGKNQLDCSNDRDTGLGHEEYLDELKRLVDDTETTANTINSIFLKSSQRNGHDADFGHYLEEQMEEEIEINRKFDNLHTTLNKMKSLSLAVHIFDQSLQ